MVALGVQPGKPNTRQHRRRHKRSPLSRTQEQEVVFNFIRVDNTTASLLLGLRKYRDHSEVYMRSR